MLDLLKKTIIRSGIPTKPADRILERLKMDNTKVTKTLVKEVCGRYLRYCLSYDIAHIGTEDRFIAKENKKQDFYSWVFSERYKEEDVSPKTPLMLELFGERDPYEILELVKEKELKIKKKKDDTIRSIKSRRKSRGNSPM